MVASNQRARSRPIERWWNGRGWRAGRGRNLDDCPASHDIIEFRNIAHAAADWEAILAAGRIELALAYILRAIGNGVFAIEELDLGHLSHDDLDGIDARWERLMPARLAGFADRIRPRGKLVEAEVPVGVRGDDMIARVEDEGPSRNTRFHVRVVRRIIVFAVAILIPNFPAADRSKRLAAGIGKEHGGGTRDGPGNVQSHGDAAQVMHIERQAVGTRCDMKYRIHGKGNLKCMRAIVHAVRGEKPAI